LPLPSPPLYTLAYPTLDASDRAFIERFRGEHDLRHRDVAAPHFTLVFGCDAVPEGTYRAHVAAVAGGTSAIRFSCRYAMLGTGDTAGTAHVFLVPDEGFAALALLHDRLYRGPLEPYLRLDLPYVPHITVGTLDDRSRAKQLCDALNEDGVRIDGRIESVCIGALVDGRIRDLVSSPLAAEAPAG